MEKQGFVYLLMSGNQRVIYTGVTSDLKKRVWEHRNNVVEGFTKRYKVHNLVYYEVFSSVVDAIVREKQIKSGSRAKKIALIKKTNPHFEDLYEKI